MNEATIFAAALETATDADRAAYLAAACAGDDKLRRRVEALLHAHAESDDLLDPAVPAGPEATAALVPTEKSRAVVAGRYKLLEEIGEGGMGTVWVAGQTQPVRRKVAVKLIKAVMDPRTSQESSTTG